MKATEFIDQGGRLIFTSFYRAECHVAAGRFFGNLHIALGTVAAGLAAGASATAFTSLNILAGCLGITAAAAAALLTSLRPDERSQLHWNAANAFADLANRTYMAFYFGTGWEKAATAGQTPPAQEIPEAVLPDKRHELGGFQNEFESLDASAPPLPGRLSRKAEKAIAENRTWYPPQNEDFESWRDRILESKAQRRALGLLWKR